MKIRHVGNYLIRFDDHPFKLDRHTISLGLNEEQFKLYADNDLKIKLDIIKIQNSLKEEYSDFVFQVCGTDLQ